MQEKLLDILIIGVLVLLFGSIYRRRPTLRLQYWAFGWLFILAHFGVLLLNPRSEFWSNLVSAMALCTLISSGICFLLASSSLSFTHKQRLIMGVFLAVPAFAYTTLICFGIHEKA